MKTSQVSVKAEATQVMNQEEATDLRRRMEAQGQVQDTDMLPVARLLDLRKAYPIVKKNYPLGNPNQVWHG